MAIYIAKGQSDQSVTAASKSRSDNDKVAASEGYMHWGPAEYLTLALVIVGAAQAWVFWVQAGRLKETIKTMKEIDEGQALKLQESITQATRAASAMEGVSTSVADNVVINTQLSESQRHFWQMQMRAYLTVVIGSATYQERDKNYFFGGQPVLVNTGNTPAHNVRHRIKSDVLNVPFPEDFAWHDLPKEEVTSGTVVGPH